MIPTKYLKDPSGMGIAARSRTNSHVETFLKVFADDKWLDSKPAVVVNFAYGDIPPASIQTLTAKQMLDGFYVISGDHRRQAYQQLREANPTEKKYKVVPCLVYFCSNTLNNNLNLQLLGMKENTTDHLILRQTFFDKAVSCFRIFMDGTSQTATEVKKALASAWGQTEAYCSTHVALARKPPEVRDRLWRFIHGEHLYRAKKQKHPKKYKEEYDERTNPFRPGSWPPINSIFGMRQENQIKLLDTLLQGSSHVFGLHNFVKYSRKLDFLEGQIVELCGFDSWEDAESKRPDICALANLETWVSSIVAVKDQGDDGSTAQDEAMPSRSKIFVLPEATKARILHMSSMQYLSKQVLPSFVFSVWLC